MASFDAMFARVGGLKAEAMAAREAVAAADSGGGGGAAVMSDQERRKKAEDTVMRLLASMGLEDEAGEESEREDE